MRIVFHGHRAEPFSAGFANLMPAAVEVVNLPDVLSPGDRQTYAHADVVVGISYGESLPAFKQLQLYQVPGAGYAGISLDRIPPTAAVCNCYGHEKAVAEYVFAAILDDRVPLHAADRQLRQGRWTHGIEGTAAPRPELSGTTIGILGYGHIGRCIASRARGFDMKVMVASRTDPGPDLCVDEFLPVAEIDSFWGRADWLVVCLPLSPATEGLVDASVFERMRSNAVIVNVGRGPIINEEALFRALSERIIRGAIVDTWYNYPIPGSKITHPGRFPFEELDNILMTPHFSGWSQGTLDRRQRVIADNCLSCMTGSPLLNVVRPAPPDNGAP